MTYIIEVLRQEHRNIERLLRVLERELGVFDRGDRPDYGVILAVIDYFKVIRIRAITRRRISSSRSSRRGILFKRRPSAISKPNIGKGQGVCAEWPRRSNVF
jgi:hypothetical protein